jgi:hypothetical protein
MHHPMRIACFALPLALGGCFFITGGEIAEHDAGLGPDNGGGDADTDTDADSDTDTDVDPDGNSSPGAAEVVADPLGYSRQCVTSELDYPDDVDWYEFTGANPGDAMLVSTIAETDNPPSPADTVLESDAGPRNDDSIYGFFGKDSMLSLAPGDKVAVSDARGDSGPDHSYKVCAELIRNRDVEPNDDLATATYLGDVAGAEGVQLAGLWDGDADAYVFDTKPGSVYLVSLVPGHTIPGANLDRLDPYTGLPAMTAPSPDYDDRMWGYGYPIDAGLMFVDANGFGYVQVDGGPNAAGPYVVTLYEVGDFRAELEPNDTDAQAQSVSLLLQGNGEYLGRLAGSMNPFVDVVDVLLIDPPASASDRVLDVVVQSASVGTDQDLSLTVRDADSGEQVGFAAADPEGILGTDPALLQLPIQNHDRFYVQVVLAYDDYWSSDGYFVSMRVRDP